MNYKLASNLVLATTLVAIIFNNFFQNTAKMVNVIRTSFSLSFCLKHFKILDISSAITQVYSTLSSILDAI